MIGERVIMPYADTDGDGLINVLDVDSDNDGLYDGTNMGKNCLDPGPSSHCILDADMGETTTSPSPLPQDTDNDGVPDGAEDYNANDAGGEPEPDDPSDDVITDTDSDGLSNAQELAIGTDPKDADSDDDGVLDGDEPNVAAEHDGNGLINGLDRDGDNDGIFDGTEMGQDCSNDHTDAGQGNCIEDADGGGTTTNPLNSDTDEGGVPDGTEDANHNGAINADAQPSRKHAAHACDRQPERHSRSGRKSQEAADRGANHFRPRRPQRQAQVIRRRRFGSTPRLTDKRRTGWWPATLEAAAMKRPRLGSITLIFPRSPIGRRLTLGSAAASLLLLTALNLQAASRW